MKRTLALAVLILVAMTGTAQAKAPDPKAACKQGGFVGYVNPATGQPFADQGTCVSYVAQGGTLVPVVVAPVVAFSSYFVTNNIAAVEARWHGDPSTSFTYQWILDGGPQPVLTGETGTSGVADITVWTERGGTVELFINGVSAGSYVAPL